MIKELITENTDEAIALMIVGGYMLAWFVGNPMPTEALMFILGYYFTKSRSDKNDKEKV